MLKYFHFNYPAKDERIVGWSPGVKIEQVTCSTNKSHKRGGKRDGILSVILFKNDIPDIIWTYAPECLIQDHVLEIFKKENVTGFEVKPVNVKYENSKKAPPVLWELVVTGWGGLAPAISGVELLESQSCKSCGHLTYSSANNFQKIIVENQLDGKDFFIVWPYPAYYLISKKVVDILKKYDFKGFDIKEVKEVEIPSFIKIATPGRLHYHMPDKRAHELGDPLGIY